MSERTSIDIESPGVNVAVVKKDYDGWKFLILKRPPDVSYGGYSGFMTGSKRGNETVAQVVVREMDEETKLKPAAIWASEYLFLAGKHLTIRGDLIYCNEFHAERR